MRVHEVFTDDRSNEHPKVFAKERMRASIDQKQQLLWSINREIRKAEADGKLIPSWKIDGPFLTIDFPPALGGAKFLLPNQEKLEKWFKMQLKVYDRLNYQIEQMRSALRFAK